MKKFLSTLLAGVLVAASAIGVSANSAGLYEYDPSDSEYWSAALSMLDKTTPAIWFEDGKAGGYNGTTIEHTAGSVSIADLTSGWYEVVFCGLGTYAEDFPEEVNGKIAFTVRGYSTFNKKSENAMNAGAIACLVGNNCRPEDEVVYDEDNGFLHYSTPRMSFEYYTIPTGLLSSDCTVRLVAATTGVAVSEAVDAVSNEELPLPEAKNSTWVYIGTEEEYKANTIRTDANTVTGETADDVIFTDNQLLITVACPVEVTVSYGGETLSSAQGKYDESKYHASFGNLYVSADGEKKTFRLLADNVYDIDIIGTDDGTMTVTVKYPGAAKEVVEFKDVPVSASMSATVNTDNTKNQNTVMQYSNGGKNEKIIGEKTYHGEIEIEEDDTPSNSVIFPRLYNVTVTSGEGGKTNTSDKFYIAYGASRTIKITPDDGYEVADVTVNGKSVGAVTSYSIKGACKNYTVKVSFEKLPD